MRTTTTYDATCHSIAQFSILLVMTYNYYPSTTLLYATNDVCMYSIVHEHNNHNKHPFTKADGLYGGCYGTNARQCKAKSVWAIMMCFSLITSNDV